jgi:hypothetical protein
LKIRVVKLLIGLCGFWVAYWTPDLFIVLLISGCLLNRRELSR